MTFLLSEDYALRQVLQGITVHDQRATNDNLPRQVGVFFGQPDQELRAQNYPYITIDMIDISRDPIREMRGMTKPEYMADPATILDSEGEPIEFDPEVHDWEVEMPIPVNIDYQITTYARQPRHDRELLAQILYQKLPFRFGQLSLDDNTYRRLEVLDVSKRDVTEQAKRLFVNAITVRIASEISQGTIRELYKVNSVVVQDIEVIN